MKKRTRIIVILILFLAVLAGWIWMKRQISAKMEAALAARYPTESFSLDKVQITLIPVGAKAKVVSSKDQISFEVFYYKGIFNKAEDRLLDDYLEQRSIKQFDELLKPRMEKYKDTITAYSLEPLVVGKYSLNPETGLYPVSMHVLLKTENESIDTFLNEVKVIADDFKANAVAGLDAMYFISFPGSVKLTDLNNIGYPVAWLTQPTPTPTPTPVPIIPETTATSASATAETTPETTKQTTPEQVVMPAFSYELMLIAPDYNTDLNVLRNQTKPVSYSVKDLNQLAEQFRLDDKTRGILLDAKNRQKSGADFVPTTSETVTPTT